MSTRVRFAGILTSLLLALGALTGPLAPPAAAGYATLCWGYSGCASKGMSNAGYAKVSGTMYWRMYAGHNCTNYAAYRIVKSGLPNVRPWSGSGNAENWGLAMASITNQTPTVGAIAWWKQNVWPAGSAGHVAYVEKVVSPTEIIVSQDSWGGDFSWARITKDGRGWPNGFVHFNDVRLANTAVPTVTGLPKVGGTLTATPGTWSPADVTVAYQWFANGTAVPGATASTYVPTADQVDRTLTVRVTAAKPGYPSAAAVSAPTAAVLPGAVTAETAPAVAGEPVVDATLTAVPGVWVPEPEDVRYRWRVDGEFTGVTDASFTPAPEHVGKRVTLRIAAVRDGFERYVAVVGPEGAVRPGTFTTTPPAVTGTALVGRQLTLQPGTASPQPTTTVTWLREGVPVPEVTGPTYPLTLADLGKTISAEVRHERAGYTTAVQQAPPTAVVRSQATVALTVRPLTRPGRARVVVRVAAPGIDPVGGRAALFVGGKPYGTVEVVDGVARTTLTGLRTGERFVRARFLPTVLTTGAKDVVTARIR